jgi:hypothetical protein
MYKPQKIAITIYESIFRYNLIIKDPKIMMGLHFFYRMVYLHNNFGTFIYKKYNPKHFYVLIRNKIYNTIRKE